MACEDRIEVEEDGAALAARLRPLLAGVDLALAGPGQFFGRTGVERVTLLRVDPGPPEALWDGPVVREEVAALLRGLGPLALPGEVDTMHATPWTTAWSVAPAPALVVDREGVVLRALGQDEAWLRDPGALPRHALRGVEATLSADWVERGVVLHLDGGRRVVVARCEEHIVHLDPTYDGLDLMVDAWAPALARALAVGLGLPLTLAPDYR
ncbi:MAG: hypothetical protein M9894_15370 [Planctomycetes bacterium]|nr:hypothetical protein [Planctomycetota bacterium]